MKPKTKSKLMAAAVAGLLISGTYSVLAATAGSTTDTSKKATDVTTTQTKNGKCIQQGANACKGQGDCGGPGYECAGNNACKGKGWIYIRDKDKKISIMTKDTCDKQKGKFEPQA